MKGVFEPVSSNVTLSPELNATRWVPLSQLAPLPLPQRLAAPSPCQTRLLGGVTGDIRTATLLVQAVPSLPVTVNCSAPMPEKSAGGTKCATCPLFKVTTPLLK